MARLSNRYSIEKKGPSETAFSLGESLERSVPFLVYPPWDLLRGRDVFRDVELFDYETMNADLAHFAPNRATFSRAREIPIPGVKNPPKPLRSSEHPRGIPEEVSKLSKRARLRMDRDTEMAEDSARRCLARHKRKLPFSLEHPGRSIALDLEAWKTLRNEEGVFSSFYHTCMFEGSKRRKFQILIHNLSSLKGMNLECESNGLCSRTGRPHEKWRPLVSRGKVEQFVTGEEREYPSGFCSAYSRLLTEDIMGGKIHSFVEVYSGPNAPLSKALAKDFGGNVDDTHESKGGRIETEAVSLATRVHRTEVPTTRPLDAQPRVETGPLRAAAVESGRQPSFGKRRQLIPDGLQNPREHLKRALELSHPFDSISSVKEDHLRNVDWEKTQEDPNRERLSLLGRLESLARDPKVLERDPKLKEGSSFTFKKIGQKLNLGLMERVQEWVEMEDKAIPLVCRQGLNITGRASCSPFFSEFEEPQKVRISEFLATAKRRSSLAVRKTEFMAQQGGKDMADAIWKKVLVEMDEGSLGPGMTLENARDLHGEKCNVVPSFGLKQGTNSRGEPKYRRIDDHTSGWVNLAAKRLQKIPMANADSIAALVKHMARNFPSSPICLATADMQAAYRQVALDPEDVPRALTAIFNPLEQRASIHEVYAQPFGAGHAVPNFYRLAEWFARFLMRFFKIQCDHFFDDFWVVSTESTAEVNLRCLLRSAELLGIRFDPDKTQLPSSTAEILGVVFDTNPIGSSKIFSVKAKPSRVAGLKVTIEDILQKGVLTPSVAASVVGKYGFLCSTLFGKVGRFASLGVRAREHSSSSDLKIDHNLETSLRLMVEFITTCRPREIHMGSVPSPVILYTDASDVPEREPRYVVGGVLVDRRVDGPALSHFHWPVPKSMVARWIPKQTYMGQLEILAGPIALATWERSLTRVKCIHFVDNDAASASLVKGYSPKSDSCELAGAYWLQAAKTATDIYIDRVESKSNLSDGPSRLEFHALHALGSVEVSPVIPPFLSSAAPSRWFSRNNPSLAFPTSLEKGPIHSCPP